MIDREQRTVRQLRASVQEWVADVDEMIAVIGHDRWLDIGIADFKHIGEAVKVDADVIALLQEWGEMAATWLEIVALRERDHEKRMT